VVAYSKAGSWDSQFTILPAVDSLEEDGEACFPMKTFMEIHFLPLVKKNLIIDEWDHL
jgi:hypothetical protein